MNPGIRTTLIIAGLTSLLLFTLWGLGDALFPLIVSFGLAYLFFPLVKKLEAKGLHRSHAVIGIFSLILVVFIVAGILIIPGLITDAKDFIKELPLFISRATARLENLAASFGFSADSSSEEIRAQLIDYASGLSGAMVKGFSKSVFDTFSSVTKWLISILSFFLVPLFFFHVINDFEKITEEIKSFFPMSLRPKLRHYFHRSNLVLSGYVRGQLMVALALSFLYGIGLSAIGLRFGILIGIGSGILSIIPYAGFFTGILVALIVGLANHESSGTLIGIVLVFSLVQALEGSIITPKLVGDKVGLGPLATILALIVGGNMAGLTGMLIAIPAAAIGKSILAELKREYINLDIYKS